jgi:hypothetical protein
MNHLRSVLAPCRLDSSGASAVGSKFIVSQMLLWLWHGDSSGTQRKGDRQPLEASIRGLVKRQQTEKTQCVLQ